MIPTNERSVYDDIDLENSPSESSNETQICEYQENDCYPRTITTERQTEYNILCFSCVFLNFMIVLIVVSIIVVTIHTTNNESNNF